MSFHPDVGGTKHGHCHLRSRIYRGKKIEEKNGSGIIQIPKEEKTHTSLSKFPTRNRDTCMETGKGKKRRKEKQTNNWMEPKNNR